MFKEIKLHKVFAERFKLTLFLLLGSLFGGVGFIAAVYPRNRRQTYQSSALIILIAIGWAGYIRFRPGLTTTADATVYWGGTLPQHISVLTLVATALGYGAGIVLRRAWHWTGVPSSGTTLMFLGTLLLAISGGLTREVAVDLGHDADIQQATADGMLYMSRMYASMSHGETDTKRPSLDTMKVDDIIKNQLQPNFRFTR